MSQKNGDLWYWEIEYKDGSILSQYNEDNTPNKIKLKDARRLSWIPYDPTRRRFDYELADGEKPVVAFRRFLPQSGHCRTIYLLGGEKLIDGKTKKCINYIQPAFTVCVKIKDGDKIVDRDVTFPGYVEQSDQREFVSALDRWARSIGQL